MTHDLDRDERVVSVDSPDTPEIRQRLLVLLHGIPELRAEEDFAVGFQVTAEYIEAGCAWDFFLPPFYVEEVVVWQLGEFRETSALARLEQIAGFDPTIEVGRQTKRPRARLVRFAKQAIKKIRTGMTDQEYVESTVRYLEDHVPGMWHKFAAWMLREVCEDQPPECLVIAEMHERWQGVSKVAWEEAMKSAWETMPRHAESSLPTQAARSAERGAEIAWVKAGQSRPERLAADTAGEWFKMAVWLRGEIDPMGAPLPSADWWEERGEPKLAELLRQQASETLP